MYQVINYICGEDVGVCSAFEISFQSIFERAQKAGDAIQELNNLVATVLLVILNNLPSLEYLWSVVLRLAIFVPYVIYSQYKQYALEKRIYELTWTLSYQLRRNMFKVVPTKSENSLRRSSSCVIKRTEFSSPASKISTSSAPGKPRRQSILEMGDMSINTRIYKIRSSPVLFHGKGSPRSPIVDLLGIPFQNQYNGTTANHASKVSKSQDFQTNIQECDSRYTEHGDERIGDMYLLRERPTKKLKRDTDDDTSVIALRDPSSMVMRIFQKPEDSLHPTVIVEYCNVLKNKGAMKYPSAISQDMSTSLESTSLTKQNLGSNGTKMSWEQRMRKLEDCESKWRRITDRNNAMRTERMTKLKEMESRKLQEKEKAKKAEIMRRRAMIARIREQNRKLLMEQKGWETNGNASKDNKASNDEIVLPVVQMTASGSIRNHHIDARDLHEHVPSIGDLAGQVPVLRLTQRTVTIERTAKISKLKNERNYSMMEIKRLQMSDEMGQNVIEERRENEIPNYMEYYLSSKETPPKRLVYIEKAHSSSVTPSVTYFANKSISEIHPQRIRKYGDVRQVRSSLSKFPKKSTGSFRSIPPSICEDFKDGNELSLSDLPSSAVEADGIKLKISDSPTSAVAFDDKNPTTLEISQPLLNVSELEKFCSADSHPSAGTQSCSSGQEGASGIVVLFGGEMIGTANASTGDELKTASAEFATPTLSHDVESPSCPPASVNPKDQRPVIKRARRRLQKEPDISEGAKNKTLQTEPLGVTHRSKELIQKTENQTKSKPQDAKTCGPKSLLLKKLELRKRLEERRRASTCRATPLKDLTSVGTENDRNDGQSLEEGSPERTKTLTERSASTWNRPRRFSLDRNVSKTKLKQTRTPPSTNHFKKCVTRKATSTVSKMKGGSLKSEICQQEQISVHDGKKTECQEKRKISTTRASCNRTTAAPNRREMCQPIIKTEFVHTMIDGSHCRKNSGGSPHNRRLCKENNVPKSAQQSSHDVTQVCLQDKPEGQNVNETQGTDNITLPNADNTPLISMPEDWNECKTAQEELAVEMKQPSGSRAEVMSDSIVAECTKNKRSEFLTFQMDESGHPVPVKHTNDRSRNCSIQTSSTWKDEKPRRSVMNRKQQTRSIVKKPCSSMRFSLKEEERNRSHVMDEKEWNKRMKTWEEKRKHLSSGRNSSKYALNLHVNENSMEIQYRRFKSRDDKYSAAARPEKNTNDGISSVISPQKCNAGNYEGRELKRQSNNENEDRGQIKEVKQETLVEGGSTKEESYATNKGPVRNQCLNGEDGNNKGGIVGIHSPMTPLSVHTNLKYTKGSTDLFIKSGSREEKRESPRIVQCKNSGNSSRSDSVSLDNNEQKYSSQVKVEKTHEMISIIPKGGFLPETTDFPKSVLSPIQSVSDNNYHSDGASESDVESKTLNIKQPFGDTNNIVTVKPEKAVANREDNSQDKPETNAVQNEQHESRVGITNPIQPDHHHTKNPRNTDMALTVLGSGGKTRTTHHLQKFGKDNEVQLRSNSQDHQHTENPRNTDMALTVLGTCEKKRITHQQFGKDNEVQLKSNSQDHHHTENPRNTDMALTVLGTCENKRITHRLQTFGKDNEVKLKSNSQVCQNIALTEPSFDFKVNCCNDDRKRVEKISGVSELKKKSSSACRKTKDISLILDQLLTVTKALKEEHISKGFKKSLSNHRVCDSINDRALSAIVCFPEGSSSNDDIGRLPGQPVFLDPSFAQKRIMNPVVVECVTSTPAEFYEKSRETNDRFLKNGKDNGQRMATRIEWYEDLYNPPISSTELDTHHDVELQCYKEIVVDRRGCKSKNNGICTARYEQRNFQVKRYEVHHDSSNCYLKHTSRRNSEHCPPITD